MDYLLAGILVVLVAGIRIYLMWLRKNDDYWKKRGVPYQPRKSFISLMRLMITMPFHEVILKTYKKYGRLYGEFELRRPILIITEPNLIRDILVKDFHVFSYRKDFNFGGSLLDKTVFSLKGENWKRIRTIITPAFTSRRMRQMSSIINESCQTIVENFGKYSDRGEPVDCKTIFGAFTMDVIASAAFATKIDSHNDPDNIFVRHVKNSFGSNFMLQLLLIMFSPKWVTKCFRPALLKSVDFFEGVILQVISQRKESGKKYNDILQLLLDAQEEVGKENSKEAEKSSEQEDETDQFGSVTNYGLIPRVKYSKLTEEELLAQCVLFFIVGYETTASTLAFLAYSLAINSECQEKVIKEIDDAFEKHKELNHDVIRDMKYLDCVVSETLRMYPNVARGERTAVEDYKLGETGIVIEKGVGVGFNMHAMHLDPEFFVNPEKFYPERFKVENISHPQYAYLPFGAGPRNCLGMRFALMEIKLCISNILRHFRFKKAPTTKVPLEYKPGLFFSAKDITLMIERRAS